jgi:hypothetical protein
VAGLLHLIPRYLPRFGMALRWAALSRPLVLTLFAVDVVITLIFDADVEAQCGAYAAGVLVLILSAAIAAMHALGRERRWALASYAGISCLVFAYTLGENCLERPEGLLIGTVSGCSWVADLDGSNPLQLTALHAPMATAPRWSPDSR